MAKKKKAEKKIEFVEGLKAKEVQDIPLEEIDVEDKTFQYRFTANVGDLKNSLTHEGQREPIDLTGSKPYRIIDGFRRVAALNALGWKTAKALIHRGVSDEEAHKLAFLKNVVRKNLSPMDKANAIFQAKQRGKKTADLAELFNLSEKQIQRYEDLLKFPPEVQKLLDKEDLTMGHAKVLSDFKVKNLDEWVSKIKENNLSAKQIKRELKKASGAKLPGRAKLYIKKEKNGIRVYPFTITKDAPEKEREKVIGLLQEAIEVLKG